jgi:cysteinyl-tRNA synthetase
MAFAMVSWQNVLELTDSLIEGAASTLSRITNFLEFAEGILSSGSTCNTSGFSPADAEFSALISKTQNDVHSAFASNFNVPAAFEAIRALIGGAYVPVSPNNALIVSAARYVSEIMRILGFNLETVQLSSSSTTGLGEFGRLMAEYRESARANGKGLLKDLQAMCDISGVRVKGARPETEAEQKKYDALKSLEEHVKKVLGDLDDLRDVQLPKLGIRLEDCQGGAVNFKLADPAELAARAKQCGVKAPPAETSSAPAAEPVARALIENPEGMFLKMTDQYSKFDGQGIPTHSADGQPLAKSRQKRLKKDYEKLLRQYQKQGSGK